MNIKSKIDLTFLKKWLCKKKNGYVRTHTERKYSFYWWVMVSFTISSFVNWVHFVLRYTNYVACFDWMGSKDGRFMTKLKYLFFNIQRLFGKEITRTFSLECWKRERLRKSISRSDVQEHDSRTLDQRGQDSFYVKTYLLVILSVTEITRWTRAFSMTNLVHCKSPEEKYNDLIWYYWNFTRQNRKN